MVFDWQILVCEPSSDSRGLELIGPELLMLLSVFGQSRTTDGHFGQTGSDRGQSQHW